MPAYQACTTAGVFASHGSMSTGPPETSTTTVRGLASTTRRTSSAWPPGSARSFRSAPSASMALAVEAAHDDRDVRLTRASTARSTSVSASTFPGGLSRLPPRRCRLYPVASGHLAPGTRLTMPSSGVTS